MQSLLGGKMAHDYADGASFYGFNLSQYLPFNVARTWHLQLAIFWIATAWLGMGIFIAPLVSGREPKGQRALVNTLFGALVLVVVGSLTGEYLSVSGHLGKAWWWLGTQGWEYMELGRLWMLLLIAGMGIWLFLVFRGLRAALKAESDRGGLTHLLLYSSVAIPVFYCFALFVNRNSHITMADYWRWWLIHLWVEGMFEVFAVVVIGFLMVRLGLVTAQSTLRAMYFQLIILLGSGIIGTGHHYYWIGAPEAWMGLGAVFSALEVIPLSLLMVEAYGQYKVIRAGGVNFPYAASFWFLVATAFWNLFGAGVLGFLINLPFVSYFEHGSFLTAAHGHGALMGVYGMLAIALALFSLRNIVEPERWKEKWIMVGFWGVNCGPDGHDPGDPASDRCDAGARIVPQWFLVGALAGILPAAGGPQAPVAAHDSGHGVSRAWGAAAGSRRRLGPAAHAPAARTGTGRAGSRRARDDGRRVREFRYLAPGLPALRRPRCGAWPPRCTASE